MRPKATQEVLGQILMVDLGKSASENQTWKTGAGFELRWAGPRLLSSQQETLARAGSGCALVFEWRGLVFLLAVFLLAGAERMSVQFGLAR